MIQLEHSSILRFFRPLRKKRRFVTLLVSVSTIMLVTLLARIYSSSSPTEIFTALSTIERVKECPLESDIERCTKYPDNSTECTVLTNAIRAYDDLFKNGRAQALKMIFSSLETACRAAMETSDSLESPWSECYGAIHSIVFFASPDEDLLILDFFETRPALLRWIFKYTSFAWVANRPHHEQWRKLVASLQQDNPTSEEFNPFERPIPASHYPINVLVKAIEAREKE